jgi:hypothetical protein
VCPTEGHPRLLQPEVFESLQMPNLKQGSSQPLHISHFLNFLEQRLGKFAETIFE